MYKIFGWQYFLQLFLVIGIVVALVFTLRKLEDKPRKIAKISLISALGLFVILEYIGRILMISDFRLGNQLPLNSHQVFVFIAVMAYFLNRPSMRKFAYLVIVPICAYGLIFVPEVYSLGTAFSLSVISYNLINAILIANAILDMIWSEDELRKKDVGDTIITFVFMIAIIHVINVIFRFTGLGIHANYFGTMGDGYDLVIGWLHSLMPVAENTVAVPLLCILPLVAVLIGFMFVLVIPFEMEQSRRKRQENIEELIALGNMKKQQEMREKSRKPKSQILVKSEHKAKPQVQKNVVNKTDSGFVTTNKEIQVHKDNTDNK